MLREFVACYGTRKLGAPHKLVRYCRQSCTPAVGWTGGEAMDNPPMPGKPFRGFTKVRRGSPWSQLEPCNPAIFRITRRKLVWLLKASFAISEGSTLVPGDHLPGPKFGTSWRLGHEFQRSSQRCHSRIRVFPWARACPLLIAIFTPNIRNKSPDIFAECRDHGTSLS
jgi:hypothetical protein